MMRKIGCSLLLAILVMFPLWGETENLNEVLSRSARLSNDGGGYRILEDKKKGYSWQPEGLCYLDVTTKSEVWRISPGSGRFHTLSDISFPSWSADGKRFSYLSSRHTGAWKTHPYNLEYGIWMVMRADGSFLRPMPEAPARTGAHAGYQHWSPSVPDVFYQFGRSYAGERTRPNELYKVSVSDFSETKHLLIRFPDTKGEFGIKKSISADGTMIVASDSLYESMWYPARVYPDGAAGLIVQGGYPSNRPSYDDFWLETAKRKRSGYNQIHDQFLCGAGSNIWYYVMNEDASGTWWRMRLTGSEKDGGPRHITDHTYPYEWGGEMEPLTAMKGNRPFCEGAITTDGPPDCTGYWSHVGFDRWGTKAVFSKAEGPYPYGSGIIDIRKEPYWEVSTFGDGAVHHDWHAFSDWSASSSTGNADQKILTQRWNDPSSSTVLCSIHRSETNNYNALARPSQSPDGTKITWHSPFLNGSSRHPDLFHVVAYYPYPPEITAVTASKGAVTVYFDWRLKTRKPRGYTVRGWPDEENDPPPPPREIEAFRLWRSSDLKRWVPLATTAHEIFKRYDFVKGGFRKGAGDFWVMTDIPVDGSWYYAITSIEPSGLESRTLSNCFRITLLNGAGTGFESSPYPAAPGGVSDFYQNLPPKPSHVKSSHRKSPASDPGHYTIEWGKGANAMVRYYNIYAGDGEMPRPVQESRIASIPASSCKGESCSWIDCFGNENGSTRYEVTSVDYQGNESH